MADLPPSLSYYGSFQGVMQILKHQSLPLFQADELRDPFLPNKFTQLDFDCQTLFEQSVKYMTSAILGKAAPKGNPNHPLQKAIRRWRGENRFSDEAEIRESLVGLLPAMVEKSFNNAQEIHADWLAYVENKRMLPFFENANNSELWLLEAERYSGAVVKFKCAEESIFEQCVAVQYSKKPSKIVGVGECVDFMVGDSNEIPADFDNLLLAQNYHFRSQKEWRLVIERSSEDELCLSFPSELIQSIYIGAEVTTNKVEQLNRLVKQLGSKISLYRSVCSDTSYEFNFEKLDGKSEAEG